MPPAIAGMPSFMQSFAKHRPGYAEIIMLENQSFTKQNTRVLIREYYCTSDAKSGQWATLQEQSRSSTSHLYGEITEARWSLLHCGPDSLQITNNRARPSSEGLEGMQPYRLFSTSIFRSLVLPPLRDKAEITLCMMFVMFAAGFMSSSHVAQAEVQNTALDWWEA